MYGLLQQVGPEVFLAFILLGLLGLRAKVTPKVSIFIKVPASIIWKQINPYDGKVDVHGRTKMSMRLIDATSRSYELTWEAALPNGATRPFKAAFRVAEIEAERKLVLRRVGLEGKSDRNELLEIRYALSPEGAGTRVKMAYYWGSRALLAQLLARADLWGGAYRMKALAETGKANDRGYHWIGALVAISTALLSLIAFALMLSPRIGLLGGLALAAMLVLALLVHEFGHVLAFRLIGQPWGRIVFLPFLGAIAVPRLPYETQAQSVFSALMGPGFSCVLLLICFLAPELGVSAQIAKIFAALGAVSAFLNLFNLLPVEPLDGGVALRSVLARLLGARAAVVLLALGVLMASLGYYFEQLALVVFGGFSILGNLRPRKIDAGLTPLSSLQVSIFFFGYVAIAAAHYTMLLRFMEQIKL